MKKFFLLMLSVFAFCAADAQVTTSGMNGTVTDADGQPLAGATVIAVHTPSGTQYGAVSDKNGGYNLQGLRTGGPYTVTFSFVGCQSVEFPGLMLSLGQTLKRDAFLKDSQELEAVVITADGKNSSMNVNRAGAVTSISNEQIELMPTVNRSMNDIMRVIKEQQPKIASQEFDNLCTMVLTIRESRAGELTEKLKKAGGSIAGEDI